jgi:hypothetical protein
MVTGALMTPADKTMKTLLLPLAVLLLLLCGCGGSQTPDAGVEQPPVNTDFPAGAALPNNSNSTSYQILIFGNSHVRSNNLADLIRQLIIAGKPGVQVNMVVAPGGAYLDERLNNDEGLKLLQSQALIPIRWMELCFGSERAKLRERLQYYFRNTDKSRSLMRG